MASMHVCGSIKAADLFRRRLYLFDNFFGKSNTYNMTNPRQLSDLDVFLLFERVDVFGDQKLIGRTVGYVYWYVGIAYVFVGKLMHDSVGKRHTKSLPGIFGNAEDFADIARGV